MYECIRNDGKGKNKWLNTWMYIYMYKLNIININVESQEPLKCEHNTTEYFR